MKNLKQANRYLKLFGLFKVPLIFYCRPKVLHIDEKEVTVMIPLRRRTKNHLNSMYFGALAVGADIAGGMIAFYISEKDKTKISLAFKSLKADFHKRPEGDVFFYCHDGEIIQNMIAESKQSAERINKAVKITAIVPSIDPKEIVASFSLTLSIKVKV